MGDRDKRFAGLVIVTGVLALAWLVLQVWISFFWSSDGAKILTQSFIRKDCMYRGISLIRTGSGIAALLLIGALITIRISDSFSDSSLLSTLKYIAYVLIAVSLIVFGVFMSIAVPSFSVDPQVEEVTVVSKDRRYTSDGKQKEMLLFSNGKWTTVTFSRYMDTKKGDTLYLVVNRGEIVRIYTSDYKIGDDIQVVRNDDPETLKLLDNGIIGETLPSEYFGDDVTWWTAIETESTAETEPSWP